jgi:hypothetical protein
MSRHNAARAPGAISLDHFPAPSILDSRHLSSKSSPPCNVPTHWLPLQTPVSTASFPTERSSSAVLKSLKMAQVPRYSKAVDQRLEIAKAFLVSAKEASSETTQASPLTAQLVYDEGTKLLYTEAKADGFISGTRQERIVLDAGQMLLSIDEAVSADMASKPEIRELDDPTLIDTVSALLDVVFDGAVFPNLSPGVGLRSDSKLQHGLPAHHSLDSDMRSPELLGFILSKVLNPLAFAVRSAIRGILHRRLINLLAANIEAAYSPALSHGLVKSERVDEYVDSVPISALYPILTTLKQQNGPPWFQDVLSRYLSLLPRRPNGVRHTIEFFAASHRGSSDRNEDSTIRVISPGTMQDLIKLFSSVPSSQTHNSWIAGIADQFLDLLDGISGPELKGVAAAIITNAFLSRRSTGSPGTLGWSIFAETNLKNINPSPLPTKAIAPEDLGTLVNEELLLLSLNRLRELVAAHPSPALTGRLVRPILLPLWGIFAYDHQFVTRSQQADSSRQLLSTFLHRCGTVDHVVLLSENLQWDGTEAWSLWQGPHGGVEIRNRDDKTSSSDTFKSISKIQRRANRLIELLKATDTSDELVVGSFIQLTETWLFRDQRSKNSQDKMRSTLLQETDFDPVADLSRAQIVQSFLQHFASTIGAHPLRILELIEQLLAQSVNDLRQRRSREAPEGSPSLADLSIIAEHDSTAAVSQVIESQEDLTVTSVSLLNAVLSALDFRPGGRIDEIMLKVLNELDQLSRPYSAYFSPSALTSIESAIATIKGLLHSHSANSNESLHVRPLENDIISQISSDFASDLAPVRTSAVSAIQKAIQNSQITIDVPMIASLLLDHIRSDPDEYVYLASITALSSLAVCRDAGYVVRSASSAFLDLEERVGLDGRLRIGEALSSLVDSMTEDDAVGSVGNLQRASLLQSIANVTIAIGSRRGQRMKELKDREKAKRLELAKTRRIENDDGDFEQADEDGDDATREKQEQETESIKKVLNAWEDTGVEDDVRIRTSALSVLGRTVEKGSSELTPAISASTTELGLSILSQETGAGRAILRRAAVLLFMSLLRAMDVANESGQTASVRLDGPTWLAVQRVLEHIIETDEDDIVKGHARVVLESGEVLVTKKISLQSPPAAPGAIALGQLKGLKVSPLANSSGTNPKIQEIT